MIQVVSVVGALMILGAYAANQFGAFGPERFIYVLLNLIGAATLATIALIERQWGFLLLEGVWAIVSLIALARLSVTRRAHN